MGQHENARSEVAQLRQRIEEEITSMHFLLNEFTIAGRHDIIAHKQRNLTIYPKVLANVIGKGNASSLFFQIYYQTMEGD